MKIKNIISEDLPPPENARKTQIAGTLPTYKKAADMLAKTGVQGKALDFGAGLGLGTGELGPDADSYEPYPGEKFKPHFVDVTKIPDNAYHKIVNLNVLNVVPNAGDQRIRDAIVKNIGRVLAPGGVAIITTRGKDVLTIKGTPGEEPMSMISKIGTYQKGFSQTELKQYVASVLGDGFDVSSVRLGPAGVMIKKHAQEDMAEARNGDTNFGSTVGHGSWVVYDGSKVKRFKSREGAKAYAEKNGGKVASSEFYADNIQSKQDVEEGKQRLDPKCWTGYKKQGTKMKGGVRVNNCVPNESVSEATGDEKFDKMLKGITGKKQVAKQQKTDTKQQARDAFGGMFGGGNPANSLGIRKKSVNEGDYPDGSSLRKPSADEWIQQYQKAVMAVKNAKTQKEYEAASDRAGSIKDLLASKGVQVDSVLEATGDEKFDSMMSQMGSSDSLNAREAVDMINELIYTAGASYEEALQQASVSFEIDPEELDALYQQEGGMGSQDIEEGETWSKHNNPRAGGMSKKSVSSYRRSHPGSKIQTAVTTKPSKLKKGSKAAKRRKSFCARMKGMKKSRTSAKTARDPNSNINKSLRRWNCESIEQMQELVMIAEQFIAKHKK
jgi:hypothetical protein